MLKLSKKICLLYVLLISVFYTCSYLAYLIPSEHLEAHILQSAGTLQSEGYYPRVIEGNPFSQLDNFTDSWMIGLCYPDTSLSLTENMFYSSYYADDSLADQDLERINVLFNIGNHSVGHLQTSGYGRYWHGYLLPLKISLYYMDYAKIRLLNYFALTFLSIWTLILVYKRKPLACFWAMLVFLILAFFLIIPLSLQFSSCFYIIFISLIILLSYPALTNTISNGCLSFFVIGAVTSYLDLLTIPLATLCIPCAIVLFNTIDETKKVICWTFAWGMGYGLLWISKWVLSSVISNVSLWSDAFQAVARRTQGDIDVTPFFLNSYFIAGMILVFLSLVIVFTYILSDKQKPSKNSVYLIFITLLVLIWYIILHNHSTIHIWFTWRLLLIPIVCLILFICLNLKKNENSNPNSVL